MNIYTILYEATGGKIQEIKVMFYCWQWDYRNDSQIIKPQKAKLTVHRKNIESINIHQATRILGIHICPLL